MRTMRVGFTTVVVLGHASVVVASLAAASWIRYEGSGVAARWDEFFASPMAALAAYVVLAVLTFRGSGLYRFDERWTMRLELRDSTKAVGLLAAVTLILLYLFKLDQVSRLFLVGVFAFMWVGITATSVLVRHLYSLRRASGRGTRHILIVGTNPIVFPLIEGIVASHPELGIHVEGTLADDARSVPDGSCLGPMSVLSQVLQDRVIDEVIVALGQSDLERLDEIVQIAHEQGKIVRIPLPSMGYSISTGEIEVVDSVPLLTISSGPSPNASFATKRLMDLVGAIVGLVVFSPFMALVALSVLLSSGRPIIYRDDRAGIHGRPITIHKFRTMVVNADELRGGLVTRNERAGPDFKIPNDPRTTKMGPMLRRTSLDELPQFWDVLLGRMSLVGPRAQRLDEVLEYDAWHMRRLSVRPGLTGLWQVKARQDPSFDKKAKLDLEYIDNWSPMLDLRILLQTIPAVLKSTGS